MRRAAQRGLTLIELVVVVAIIALIMGVAVPLLLTRARARGLDGAGTASAAIAQAPPTLAIDGPSAEARPPSTESTDVRVRLTAFQVLDGWRVQTRYRAEFTGTFVVANPDVVPRRLRVTFPLPPGVTEASGVSLRVRAADGELREPDDVRYALHGIEATVALAPGQHLPIVALYTAYGQNAFQYDVAGAGRSGAIQCEIDLVNVERPVVPVSSLQPTAMSASRIEFSFQQLVTNRSIVVELPAAPSPLGRLVLICQLAALGVLLFGAGYWYLSERRAPGSLDDFRWAHFLLLGLNYALFFALFALASLRWDVGASIALAASVSLPLLGVHVSRLSGARFATREALPFAAATFAVVISLVMLPEVRALTAGASLVAAIAFVTVTYGDWSSGRRRNRQLAASAARRAAREQAARKLLRELEEERADAVDAGDEAAELLAERDCEFDAAEERAVLEDVRAALEATQRDGVRAFREALAALSDSAEKAHGEAARRIEAALRRRLASVRERIEEVRRATSELRDARKRPPAPAPPEERSEDDRCIACGTSLGASGRYCPGCGVARPTRARCGHCEHETVLPTHLLRCNAGLASLFCMRCGEGIAAPVG